MIGDAIVTNIKNLPIGVLTADCAPILILDYKKKIIAAVHAGWKGAYKNIVIKVLKKLICEVLKPFDIQVISRVPNLGWCLSPGRFIVSHF